MKKEEEKELINMLINLNQSIVLDNKEHKKNIIK